MDLRICNKQTLSILFLFVTISTYPAFAGDDPWSEAAKTAPAANAAEIQIESVTALGRTSSECANEAQQLMSERFNKAEVTAALERGPERGDGELGVAGHALTRNVLEGTGGYMMILELAAGHEAIAKQVATAECTIDSGAMTFYQGAREGNAVQMVEGGHQFAVITVSLAHAVRGFAALQTAPNAIASNPRVTGFVRDAFGGLAAKTQPQITLAAAVPIANTASLSGASRLAINELFMASSDGQGDVEVTDWRGRPTGERRPYRSPEDTGFFRPDDLHHFYGGRLRNHIIVWGGGGAFLLGGALWAADHFGWLDEQPASPNSDGASGGPKDNPGWEAPKPRSNGQKTKLPDVKR